MYSTFTYILQYCNLYAVHNAYPGLFPPAGPQVWDPQLPWQPIPVHTVPLDQDYLLNKMHAFCPRYEGFYIISLLIFS